MELDELIQLLRNAERNRFYGKLEIAYQNGRCTAVYRHETVKAAHVHNQNKPFENDRGEPNNVYKPTR